MNKTSVGIVGAAGNTGTAAVAEARLRSLNPIGFSRKVREGGGLDWQRLVDESSVQIPLWIDAVPIVTFHERRDHMLRRGARKIVALSSTSRFTKSASTSPKEAQVARDLQAAEQDFIQWCEAHSIAWVILRPTLIYGSGRDKNIVEIAGMIRRFGVFPLLGGGIGKRQPIHAEDLGAACVAALASTEAVNRAYNVSGGEVVTYRQMVERVFKAMGRPALIPRIPLSAFRLALSVLNKQRRFSHWTPEMAERMNQDMAFDYSEAARDFGFQPRPFAISGADV